MDWHRRHSSKVIVLTSISLLKMFIVIRNYFPADSDCSKEVMTYDIHIQDSCNIDISTSSKYACSGN